ncbi:uncharacterized protein SPAPADRAFT_139002 [Spathaspora passalidarum NRRL Y-27907]|uniref:Uncharacterized protein n=1 Tax=Spathaspora passalidarum (strain NRRL Y-27907 / 11-Y1) TaxID=619300 RepID=G3APH0_SPAPN|nr:uncharacterized protein SPAPADRAFT_139002 [Spathaspora passalidarum NRRL Y-27907]EGW32141.1 hypothetical protein SPAPADRAFT_139002 [Spathaspora passalidarum NRRL Y-27907]
MIISASIRSSPVFHDVVLNKFRIAPNGEIYERDIKDMFAMLIIHLDLKSIKSKRFVSLTKTFPYCFDCNTAVKKMKDMSISIEVSKIVTRISYKLHPEVSLSLLSKFYRSKFLHSPVERTASELTGNMVFQPTPKGLAIVQAFCERNGMKKCNLPEILNSNFNSMELFCFERDWESDKVLYSKYLLHLLFSSLMGPKPNVWSSSNEQDPLPSSQAEDHRLSTEFQTAKSFQEVEGFSFVQFRSAPSMSPGQLSPQPNSWSKTSKNEVSPFHHRYFTNPESDAHIQYYVSSVGVRLFKDKTFHLPKEKKLVVDYSMSGKAICQWLLDCTDVLNIRQAKDIADSILKNKLIKQIAPDQSSGGHFSSTRNSYYTITESGLSVSQWDKCPKAHFEFLTGKHSGKQLTLEDILKDPGMRLQFRMHLNREYCLENLEAYMHLKYFDKILNNYKKLLKYVHERSFRDEMVAQKIDRRLQQLKRTCSTLAYQIFITYLSDGAPSVVNIAYKLKASISDIFISTTQSNISELLLNEPNQTDTEEDIPTSDISSFVQLHDESIKLLSDVSVLFSQVSNHLYRLMEVDSMPRFLKGLSNRNH